MTLKKNKSVSSFKYQRYLAPSTNWGHFPDLILEFKGVVLDKNLFFRFDRTLGGHAMEMRLRDHLIKLFKVLLLLIGAQRQNNKHSTFHFAIY